MRLQEELNELRPYGVEKAELASTAKVDLGDNDVARTLGGGQNENLKIIERRLGVRVGQRGTELHLTGSPEALALAVKLVEELRSLIQGGSSVYREDVEQAIKVLGRGSASLKEVFVGPVFTKVGNKQVTPKSIAQKRYVDAIRMHDIVFAIGPAGTGKTYLAMAMAVAALQQRRCKRIILARPAVEAGEKLGFLPGDLAEKVNPYLRPLYDALHDMLEVDRVTQLLDQGTVEVAPLAFMRGRTLNDAFVILDEAQNTTIEQMKMFLTRLGFNSKAVITGDITQIDLPFGRASGLTHAGEILKGIEGIAFAMFTEVDVVRHPLVQEVIRAYARDAAPSAASSDTPDRKSGAEPAAGSDGGAEPPQP
jgi:phosphate starvation-inducible PhoH-like protein